MRDDPPLSAHTRNVLVQRYIPTLSKVQWGHSSLAKVQYKHEPLPGRGGKCSSCLTQRGSHYALIVIQAIQLLHKPHLSKAHSTQRAKLTLNAARLRPTNNRIRYSLLQLCQSTCGDLRPTHSDIVHDKPKQRKRTQKPKKADSGSFGEVGLGQHFSKGVAPSSSA